MPALKLRVLISMSTFEKNHSNDYINPKIGLGISKSDLLFLFINHHFKKVNFLIYKKKKTILQKLTQNELEGKIWSHKSPTSKHTVFDISLGNDFLDLTPKSKVTRVKINTRVTGGD